MDVVNITLSLLTTAAVLAIIPVIGLLQRRMSADDSDPTRLGASGAATLGAVVAVAGFSLRIGHIPTLVMPPLVAIGALFAVLASSPARLGGARQRSVYLFAALATALIYVPVSLVMFAMTFDPLGTHLGTLDLGGSLPALVATGAAGLGVATVGRWRGTFARRTPGWRLIWPAVLLWALWIAWLVGFELAIDPATPIIAGNAVGMPIAGVLASALVERLRHRSNSVAGLVTGLLAGLAAATPACAYVQSSFGVIIACAAGAICALLPRSGRLLGTMLVSAALSLVLLGAFATNLGFIYTGQPEVLIGQLISAVGAAVFASVIGAALWAGIRRLAEPRVSRSSPRG